MQFREEVGRLRGLGRGGEDGAAVGLEDLQPVLDIGRMVRTGNDGNLEIGAEERRTQLGYSS